eukprot:CAMPEP_0172658566 /NCGR_PEP_ID=MMETSP1074-20121228/2863_1 /TAXON_ID=2916 /ORGANISM="Ceratium fusus, Strain PA161109" /LENGTH=112 /DNA_ID=CAMNT_0013473885 /DNA_START=81 /DNA_END=419 /DNA_ORIENTATION=-
MSAQRAHLLPTLLAVVAVVLVGSWAATAFVPSVVDQPGLANNEVVLRGYVASAAAVAAAAGPLAASAEDPVFDYNMRGEITESFITGYFALTTIFTLIAFGSYLVLTKLKII